jgi:hypothetical protein
LYTQDKGKHPNINNIDNGKIKKCQWLMTGIPHYVGGCQGSGGCGSRPVWAKNKFARLHICEKKNYTRWHMPVIPAMSGSLKYEDCGPGSTGQKARPYS